MHFKVAVEELMPAILLNESNETLLAEGPLIDFLELLAEQLNFTYSLKRSVDNYWGTLTPNGWTGMIGMILRNEVDFSLGPFSLTYDRWSAVPMSDPVYIDHIEILLPVREFHMSFFTVLTIYRWDVWLSLMVSIITVSVVTAYFNKLHSNPESFKEVTVNYFWQVYRMFLLQGYKENNYRGPVSRYFNVMLMFSTLIMSYAFSSTLLTNLVVRKVKPIESMQDLIASNLCPILEKHSSTFTQFKNSQSDDIRTLFQRANRDPDQTILTIPNMISAGINLVEAGSHALLLDGTIVRSILANKIREGRECNFKIAKYPVRIIWKVMAFSKTFPIELLHKINTVIQKSTASGLISSRIDQQYAGYTACLSQTGGKSKSLSLDHVKGLFLLWGMGCSSGLIAFLVEYYISKRTTQL